MCLRRPRVDRPSALNIMSKPCVVWLVFYFVSCCLATDPPETDFNIELLENTDSEEELDPQYRFSYPREGGTVVTKLQEGTTVFKVSESPYILINDITVGPDSKLIIEAGVEVMTAPGMGIDVKGVLYAKGNKDSPIIFTSTDEPKKSSGSKLRRIRLIDGPSILAGRVQLFQHGKWHSLCTNSRNWTRQDVQAACQQLGFEGGQFWKWFPREDKPRSRVVYANPECEGIETKLSECNWASLKMGGGSCDGHPDLGIQCSMYLRKAHGIDKHWRGIRFEHAKSEMQKMTESAEDESISYSHLEYVHIRYAGVGHHFRAASALEIIGVPPEMEELHVTQSAYNGISIRKPNTVVSLHNVWSNNNRGYGAYIRSYYNPVILSNCNISNNGADGVKYVREEKIDSDFLNDIDFKDLCSFSESDNHTYPVYLKALFDEHSESSGKCFTVLETDPGKKFTLSFLRMWGDTTNNGSAVIEVFDGEHPNYTLLAKVDVKNGMKAQSIMSTRNAILIQFETRPTINAAVFMKLTALYEKYTDLAVTTTTVEANNGHGIVLENPLSMLTVFASYIKNNSITGIHVLNGVADINFINSHTIFNQEGGINSLNLYGRTMVNDSVISSNSGPGFTIQHSQERDPSYIAYSEAILIRDTQIIKNSEYGLVFESYCGNPFVNLTRNVFLENGNNALDIKPCIKYKNKKMNIQVEHNDFSKNHKLDVKIEPAVNIEGVIEHNSFTNNTHGCMLIRNHRDKDLDKLSTNVTLKDNSFKFNSGVYVINVGLSPYSKVQSLLITKNVMLNNTIQEPYMFTNDNVHNLVSRNKVAAVVIVSSSNVLISRNIIENPLSNYEIGTHLDNPNAIINCTYNWLGYQQEDKIVNRIFDRTDRYNLALLEYLPFLLNKTVTDITIAMDISTYIQTFVYPENNHIGGELNGTQVLTKGTYRVQRDIHVLPGGKLVIQPGAVLRFPPSIGMLVSGKLEALGEKSEQIKFTLEDGYTRKDNMRPQNKAPNVQLQGGANSMEGWLLVHIGNKWGTVCSYGWTVTNAAVVCHSLGYVLNPNDWLLTKEDIPQLDRSLPILLGNVQCDEDDVDLLECRSEAQREFKNSCSRANVVGVRCYESAWAGVRFGILAQTSKLQFVTVEKAGLFDYRTNAISAGIQLDFAHHLLNFTTVQNNLHNGLEILYPNIYSEDFNMVLNSTFDNNGGNGISIHHPGYKISGSVLSDNSLAGIYYSPSTKLQQQKELVNWLKIQANQNIKPNNSYTTVVIPEQESGTIHIDKDDIVFIMTEKIDTHPVMRHFQVTCDPTHLIGLQVLNPIQLKGTESIQIYNSDTVNSASRTWSIEDDLMIFPLITNSSKVSLRYTSGNKSLGDAILVMSAVPAWKYDADTKRAQVQNSLILTESKLNGNKNAIMASYFERCHNEDETFLGKSMELIEVSLCSLTDSQEEVVYVDSSVVDICKKYTMDVTFDIKHSVIENNAKGILHTSRIHNNPSSAYHWIVQGNNIKSNTGSFELYLPYQWQPRKTIPHSVAIFHNVWQYNDNFELKIDGGFTYISASRNLFHDNRCKTGLISVQGMEKSLYITHNVIFNNQGSFMVEYNVHNQLEQTDETVFFFENELKRNKFNDASCAHANQVNKEYQNFTSVLKLHGQQKVRINRNLIGNNCMDYNIIAGIETVKINDSIDATENWWGSLDEAYITRKIFDFDDWNNHIAVNFRPYLTYDARNAILSDVQNNPVDGHIYGNEVLKSRREPYIVRRDITVMPNGLLTIEPGVVMLFAPNVGILVLGSLKAVGRKGEEIQMLPLESKVGKMVSKQREIDQQPEMKNVRLCTGLECDFPISSKATDIAQESEGYLQFYDNVTKQWLPSCDASFSAKDAKVVCGELGFSYQKAYADLEQYLGLPHIINNLLWPTSPKCNGDEERIRDCPAETYIRSEPQMIECKSDSFFVYIYCEQKQLETELNHWGGIRFARSELEDMDNQILTKNQLAAVPKGSHMQYVNIIGAGTLHAQKTSCIQIAFHPVSIHETNITSCISDGIHIISTVYDTDLFHNRIESSNGVGIKITSLSVEDKGFEENTLNPLQNLTVPTHVPGILNMCDVMKVINVTGKILLHFKYDGRPTVCTKIFSSIIGNKTLGFRFLQFNLFNLAEQDSIVLYNGDMHSSDAKVIAVINGNKRTDGPFFYTSGQILSIQLFISKATNATGFIAEVFTLPVAANASYNVQHNISSCIIKNNAGGGVKVTGLNYAVNVEWNQFIRNYKIPTPSKKFPTWKSAVIIDYQNRSSIVFKNNLVQDNQGGLLIQTSSSNPITTMKGWITNNLFSGNKVYPALEVTGSQSSTNQEILISGNYFTKNYSPSIITIKEVVSNFSNNAVIHNGGTYILKMCRNKELHPEKHMIITKNIFHKNEAASTIFAGAPEQQYSDNILLNPASLYEIRSGNISLYDHIVKSSINAQNNWWGVNRTEEVMSRILDHSNASSLLPVTPIPFYDRSEDIKEICFLGSAKIEDSCYMYIGAPVTFSEAKRFCKKLNASLPPVAGRYSKLQHFLKQQHKDASEKVWVQDSNSLDQCTTFSGETVLTESCEELHSFICTTDKGELTRAEELWKWRLVIHCVFAFVIIVTLMFLYCAATHKVLCFRENQRESSSSLMELIEMNEAYSENAIGENSEEASEGVQSEDNAAFDHGSGGITSDTHFTTTATVEVAESTHEAVTGTSDGTKFSSGPAVGDIDDIIQDTEADWFDENDDSVDTNAFNKLVLKIEDNDIYNAVGDNYEKVTFRNEKRNESDCTKADIELPVIKEEDAI